MSTETMTICDTCGASAPYGRAVGAWYKLDAYRAHGDANHFLNEEKHACSPKCAAPLLIALFEAIGKDAAKVAMAKGKIDAINRVKAERAEGMRLLGEGLSELLCGKDGER